MTRREESEDFLGRWSARKLKARAEPPEAAPASEPAAEAAPEQTEAEFLAEHGLPEPETLGKGDDFSAFLRDSVPAALRSRALRRLWLTDPVFANVDGLVEYGEDYTDAATAMKAVKSAYQVGKGMLSIPDETPAASAAAPAPGEDAPAKGKEDRVAESVPTAEPAAAAPAPDPAGPPAGDASSDAAPEPEAGMEPEPVRPRPMRFRFEA